MKLGAHQVDLAISVLLYLLFGFFYTTSREIPPDSLFFVDLAIWSLFLLNSVYFMKTVVDMTRRRSRNSSDEEQSEQVLPSRVMIVLAITVLYIFILIPLVGFYFASAISSFCLMYFLSLKNWAFLITVPVLMPLTTYLIFEKVLHIPFTRL